jgi:hypothetical protein
MNSQNTPSHCCTVCDSDSLSQYMSFGLQPPSNRFMDKVNLVDGNEKYKLSLGSCSICGTIQLVERMPLDAVRPRFDWLVYNEPEGHLDDVADRIATLEGIDTSSRFMGVTYKDQSSLDRMMKRGFKNTECMKEIEMGSPVTPFGLETIQDMLVQSDTIAYLKKKYGQADVLLARHIVEHASSSKKLIDSLSTFVTPRGYLIIELPDSERILNIKNYPFIWEEHISYFTELSATRLAREANTELVWLGRYAYPYEDSLIMIMRFSQTENEMTGQYNKEDVAATDKLLSNFANQFDSTREQWRMRIEKIKADGKKVAMFGAGHLAAKFINFFNLSDLIDCVVDDHPKKLGMYMPGSCIPIVPSSELERRGIKICISTLNPESEAKVRKKLNGYFSKGGEFLSAFVAK